MVIVMQENWALSVLRETANLARVRVISKEMEGFLVPWLSKAQTKMKTKETNY
jgi:hypothetical protein